MKNYRCGPLRVSAISASNCLFNAEPGEIRRGPQRKRVHWGSLLFATLGVLVIQSAGSAQTTDFSKFQHSNPNHSRLPCLLCHRRENNAANLTWPGKDHLPCTGCHAQQFADKNHPICTNCHTNNQSGALKAFPPLRSFDMRFSHARHSGSGCNPCHSRSRGGVALSIPARASAHNVCFSCHKPGAAANDRNISSCGLCHQPGGFRRKSESAAAFRVGFSHARHDASEGLRCVDCHKTRAGAAPRRQVTSPVALNHHASPRTTSCMTCHNGKRAFGGDDFSTCVRCHRGNTWRF
jgi:c(7)-type cytochrome triheme protein